MRPFGREELNSLYFDYPKFKAPEIDKKKEQTADINSLIADGSFDPFNPEHHALKEKYENQSNTQGHIDG